MQDKLAIAAIIFYALSAVYFLMKFYLKKEKAQNLAFLFLMLGLVAHGLNILAFSLAEHRIPAGNLAEAFSSVAWLTILLFTLIARRDSMEGMGLLFPPIAIAAILIKEFNGLHQSTMEPMLSGEWVFIHIPLMILSVSCLALTSVLAIMYLLQERQLKSKQPAFFYYRLPSLETCENLASKSLWVGFVLLTLGILTGMILSKNIHGYYWSWDYKEIWSLITWILYAILVQGQILAAWRGRKAAYLEIVGFALMLFTFAGVSSFFKVYHAF